MGQRALAYKNVKDFIAAAKAANSPFKMGGTGSKREDHVLTVFMEKKTGAKFAYLPSTSRVARRRRSWSAITRRRTSTTPSENLEVWRAGQVRALCVFDKERIAYKTKVTDTQSWNESRRARRRGSTSST